MPTTLQLVPGFSDLSNTALSRIYQTSSNILSYKNGWYFILLGVSYTQYVPLTSQFRNQSIYLSFFFLFQWHYEGHYAQVCIFRKKHFITFKTDLTAVNSFPGGGETRSHSCQKESIWFSWSSKEKTSQRHCIWKNHSKTNPKTSIKKWYADNDYGAQWYEIAKIRQKIN